MIAASALASACAPEAPAEGPRGPRPEEIPEMVDIPAGKIGLGFAAGSQRGEALVDAFSISKVPTTVWQYRACVEAGACAAPQRGGAACGSGQRVLTEGRTFDVAGGDALPVTCVSPAQAAAYCEWLGGALPDLQQWLYAARGEAVHRFSSGDSAPSCEQHPRAIPDVIRRGGCCPEGSCDPVSFYATGARPDAASPLGIADVLATQAELLRRSEGATVPACQGRAGACAVLGVSPGAIDYVTPILDNDEDRSPTYGFRCVIERTP